MKLVKHIILLLLIVVGYSAQGQYYSFSQHVQYADECYQNQYYLLAVEHYSEATAMKGNLKKSSLFQFADAAFKVNNLRLSESLFMQYMQDSNLENDHIALSRLVEIRQMQERYEEAIIDCNIYISEYEELDSSLTRHVNGIKESCEWVLSEDRKAIVDTVINLKEINTAFSEQAPFLFGDSLYYNAVMKEHIKDKQKTFISRIYKSNKEVFIEGISEDKFVSHPSFSQDGKYVFYTVGEYNEELDIECDIYFSLIEADSTFGVSKKLLEPVNGSLFSSTHPVIVPQDTVWHLYFSSDMPGGQGGFDLWRAILNKGFQILDLDNLDGINTPGDEYSPYVDFNTNVLYFSSNGRPGYGGFDIFRTEIELLGDTEPENIGPLINSSYNDLFFSMNTNGSTVYFTSNRPGSMYLDSKFEACCYDIYKAEVTECQIDLLALVYDITTGEQIDGSEMTIIDPESLDTVYTLFSENNIHEVELDCDKLYTIITDKEKYDTNTTGFQPANFSYGQENEIVKKINLNPSIYDLNLAVFSKDTNLPLDSLDVILKNLDTEEETVILKSSNNQMRFDLIPDKDYSISIARRGYRDTMEIFNSGIGMREINKNIYLDEKEIIRQAKVSLENAIPVALFFDHDAPKPGSSDSTSATNYSETFENFFEKSGKYIFRYVSQFKGTEQNNARRNASKFFDEEVKIGFKKYDVFKNQLLLVLESGQTVNIYLRGYASPIALDEYNRLLGKRRVDSVRREFDEWGDGALLPYIMTGQLIVTERSFGEETSPKEVSDDPRKPFESIYSPSASRERRVEIDEINFNEN